MARHPSDEFRRPLDDDPEVRAVLDDRPTADPAAFIIDPGAAAGRLSDREVAWDRRLQEARDRAHARRMADEERRAWARIHRRANGARLGGCLVLASIFVVGVLCGMTIMIVGG